MLGMKCSPVRAFPALHASADQFRPKCQGFPGDAPRHVTSSPLRERAGLCKRNSPGTTCLVLRREGEKFNSKPPDEYQVPSQPLYGVPSVIFDLFRYSSLRLLRHEHEINGPFCGIVHRKQNESLDTTSSSTAAHVSTHSSLY